jgi:hypothetical protein
MTSDKFARCATDRSGEVTRKMRLIGVPELGGESCEGGWTHLHKTSGGLMLAVSLNDPFGAYADEVAEAPLERAALDPDELRGFVDARQRIVSGDVFDEIANLGNFRRDWGEACGQIRLGDGEAGFEIARTKHRAYECACIVSQYHRH